MFINRSKNKSGTTSVRVLQKRGRNNVLVKSFGSSRDMSEIERMVEQAQEFIRRQTGTYYNLFNQPPEQNLEDFTMSDLAATNCGCGNDGCGCNNNCGCGNGTSLFGDNSCSCILWIICLMCLCGNNGCGCSNNCGYGNDSCWIIIVLLLLCSGGCGCGNNGCGC